MDKLAVINSMRVEEWDSGGSELEYVLVAKTEENIEKLKSVGATDEDLRNAMDSLDGLIDISLIAFQHTNANWFSPKKGFYEVNEVEIDGVIMTNLSEDEWTKQFIQWLESRGEYFGGLTK